MNWEILPKLLRLQGWLHRLWGTFRRRRSDRELEEELALHLALAEEEAVKRGESSDQAPRVARIHAGGAGQAMDALRDQQRLPWLQDLAQDLRYSLQNLLRAPGFTVVTILMLALGIGANTGIFSIVNAALLRPLPYPEPDRLVAVSSINPSPNGKLWGVAPADYRDWRDQSTTLEKLAAYTGGSLSLLIGDRPEAVTVARVTGNFFDTFGVPPLFGRGFLPDDERTGTGSIVLSHRFWQNRFGGDPAIVGTSIRMPDGVVKVVGVMPPAFMFPDYADVWSVIVCCGEIDRRATRYWRTVGRLRDGTSITVAQAELEALASHQSEIFPNENRGWSAAVLPFGRAQVQDIRQALWILMGAVGFVIVIACANVAGLTLARSAGRRREVAVRLALGATRWRLVRQLLVEGLVVSVLGAAAGIPIARWGIGGFFMLLPQTTLTSLVRFRNGVQMDGTVLLFTLLLSVVTATVLTLVPVMASRRLAPAESLRTPSGDVRTRKEHRAYKALVVTQISCAIVLLAGAGLLAQSLLRMLEVEYGYDPRGLVTMSLPVTYQDWPVFLQDTMERINAAPGVESAAVMSYERFGQLNFPFNIKDAPLANGDVVVRYSSVTPEYFHVLRLRVLAGRAFDARDSQEAAGVVVINEALAKEYFPDRDPVGRDLVLAYNNQRMLRRIVGVVSNVRQDEPIAPVKPEILVPWQQLPWLQGTLLIRESGDVTGTSRRVQEIIWSNHGNAPASRVQTVEEILESQVATPRLYTILLGLFSIAAVALAALGIYGLLAYLVGRRTREMAIRIAVGAGFLDIIRMVIGEGLRLSFAGIALGLAGTLALTRVIGGLLFEVTPTDPVTFASVALLLLAIASAACYIPARRAAKTDPMVALRQD